MGKVVIAFVAIFVAIVVNYYCKDINDLLSSSLTTTSPHKSWDELKEGIAYLYDKVINTFSILQRYITFFPSTSRLGFGWTFGYG
jgi:hypothetical protein